MARGTDRIDRSDRKILNILSTNVHIPLRDVITQCNVSRIAIHQCVRHLAEKGIITSSEFYVNPKSLSYFTCTYVGLNLERGSIYKKVVAELQEIPGIIECHLTTSPYTMMIKLYARDNEQLMNLLNNRIQTTPGVANTETLIPLEQNIKRKVSASADEE